MMHDKWMAELVQAITNYGASHGWSEEDVEETIEIYGRPELWKDAIKDEVDPASAFEDEVACWEV